MELDGHDDCTRGMCLMALEHPLVKMINFMLCIIYYNFSKWKDGRKERREEKEKEIEEFPDWKGRSKPTSTCTWHDLVYIKS